NSKETWGLRLHAACAARQHERTVIKVDAGCLHTWRAAYRNASGASGNPTHLRSHRIYECIRAPSVIAKSLKAPNVRVRSVSRGMRAQKGPPAGAPSC